MNFDFDAIAKQVSAVETETIDYLKWESDTLVLDPESKTQALTHINALYVGPHPPHAEGNYWWLETGNPPDGWTLWIHTDED